MGKPVGRNQIQILRAAIERFNANRSLQEIFSEADQEQEIAVQFPQITLFLQSLQLILRNPNRLEQQHLDILHPLLHNERAIEFEKFSKAAGHKIVARLHRAEILQLQNRTQQNAISAHDNSDPVTHQLHPTLCKLSEMPLEEVKKLLSSPAVSGGFSFAATDPDTLVLERGYEVVHIPSNNHKRRINPDEKKEEEENKKKAAIRSAQIQQQWNDIAWHEEIRRLIVTIKRAGIDSKTQNRDQDGLSR